MAVLWLFFINAGTVGYALYDKPETPFGFVALIAATNCIGLVYAMIEDGREIRAREALASKVRLLEQDKQDLTYDLASERDRQAKLRA